MTALICRSMDFGAIPLQQLDQVDFTLPPDPPQNLSVLQGRYEGAVLKIGATRWTATEWVGSLYPRKSKPEEFLGHYSRQFSTVELNATYHKLYTAEELKKWVSVLGSTFIPEQIGGPFVFCPKLFQGITHRGSLRGKEGLVQEFAEGIRVLDHMPVSRLGPVFLQLGEQFSPTRQVELLEFLSALPAGIRWMIELRHPDWFSESSRMQQFFETLTKLGIGLVITDVAGRRDVCHMRLPISETMIRFVGNQAQPVDYSRIDAWAIRLQDWFSRGLKSAYFMLHMGQETCVPEFGVYTAKRFRDITGLPLVVPELEPEEPRQGALF